MGDKRRRLIRLLYYLPMERMEKRKEKSELREEILKFILLVFWIFVLIWAVRTESWIALALSVMAIINVAMKY